MAVIFLCFATFVMDYWLIQTYPVLYWYDPYIRLVHRDDIIVGRWLPLLQLVIFTMSRLTADLTLIRTALAMVAALTVASMYGLAARLFNELTGLAAATLLASNLMFIGLSTVPYQENLFILLVFLGLYYLEESRRPVDLYLGVMWINLACLTRYEGWLLVCVLVIETGATLLRHGGGSLAVRRGLQMIALLGVAPLGWLAFGAMQSYSNLTHIMARLSSLPDFFAEFYALLRWQVQPGILVLGGAGLLLALASSPQRRAHLRMSGFLAMDLALISLTAPYSPGNLRQTFVTLVFVILYAAFALDRLFAFAVHGLRTQIKLPLPGRVHWLGMTAVVLVIALLSTMNGVRFVAGAAREPDFYIPYLVGRWLTTDHLEHTRVLALTDNVVQRYALSLYSDIALSDILDAATMPGSAPLHTRQQLAQADINYIVALYHAASSLSPQAQVLLHQLETGVIPSQVIYVDTTRIWVLDMSTVDK